MKTHDDERLEKQNQAVRSRLAALGVQCDQRRLGESARDENRRLRKELEWYLGVLGHVEG
jgi:hypothetical protein